MAVIFEDTIRALRHSRRLTQEELGEQLGITRTVVSAYENGVRQPSHEVLWKMAGVFHVSLDYLYNYQRSQKDMSIIDLTGIRPDNQLLLHEMVRIVRLSEKVADCDK